MINNFVNFSILILFLTNTWVFLYKKILNYLNYLYPAKPTEVFFYSGASSPEPFEIILYLILSILLVGVIVLLSQSKVQKLYERLLKKLGPGKYLLLVFLTGLFLTKLGNFPLAGDVSTRLTFSFPDLAFFYGPIYEIIKGKTIFTDVRSDYGFFSILFFTIIHSVTKIKFTYMPIILSFFDIVQYLLCFYLIFKISKSLIFSSLGFFSILVINYFAATYGPQASAIRWLPLILSLFLVYKLKRIDHIYLLFLFPVFTFWSIDSGIQITLAYFFTLLLMLVAKKIKPASLVRAIGILLLSFILTIGAVEIFHVLLGYKPVDFFKIYHSVRKYALAGESMVPIPTQTYFWLFMLLYFSSIYYFFKDVGNGLKAEYGQGSALSLLLFSANLMFFTSTYYVGRSMPHELYTLSLFAILTLLLLVGYKYSTFSKPIRIFVLLFILIFLILIPGYMRFGYIANRLKGDIFALNIDKLIQNKYFEEILLINKNIPDDRILLLSPDDTYLLYFLGKKNILDQNPVSRGIQMYSELGPALKQAVNICPKKIVVECEMSEKCGSFERLTYNDQLTFPIVLLAIEKSCGITYSPTSCTNKLCIAQSN